jgi:hypothetical protein
MDPALMSSILGSLPGVNPDDPRIKSALDGKKKEDESKKK